jgi:hypothetical protein
MILRQTQKKKLLTKKDISKKFWKAAAEKGPTQLTSLSGLPIKVSTEIAFEKSFSSDM